MEGATGHLKMVRWCSTVFRTFGVVVCLCLVARPLTAAEPAGRGIERLEESEWGDVMKTLGGRQLWGDMYAFHEWRIQRHVVTGHYRLLDGNDFRHASGRLEDCRQKLDEITRARELEPMKGKAVILLHGIIRSSKSFPKMRARLREEGYHVVGFDYPSTQISIPEAAAFLDRVVKSMPEVEEINFVVHSMGGLVVRAWLAGYEDERIGRMVMLGTPNQGACMADKLQRNILYKALYGPAGQQLVSGDESFIAKLPVPEFEFAIIAGARGEEIGWNPLIPGDDDGTISVECSRLPGATDFSTVYCLHSFLMNDAHAVDQTARFLTTGRLRAEGDPQPIPRPEPAGEPAESVSP